MHIRIFLFTAYDPDDAHRYSYPAWQLPSGEVLVPQEQTHDLFYDSLDAVEAYGNDEIAGYEDTGTTLEVRDIDIQQSIRGSLQEFGKDAVPTSLRSFLRQ